MKQLLQDLATGQTMFVEAPMPRVGEESVLIRSTVSLISAGTERMLINFSKANLFNKARQQPENQPTTPNDMPPSAPQRRPFRPHFTYLYRLVLTRSREPE